MNRSNGSLTPGRASAVVCALLLSLMSLSALAQGPPPPDGNYPQPQEPSQLLSPQQLEDLVAPIALYPDPLLSQVLAASTYPFGNCGSRPLASAESGFARSAVDGRREAAALGRERAGVGGISRCSGSAKSRHSLDHRSGECFPRSAGGCHGCDSVHARAGSKQRTALNHAPTGGYQ